MGLLPCDVKAVLNTARQVLGAIVRALDHGALSMNPATLAPDIRQAYARIEVVAAQENLFQNRLDTIHSCLKGRYPFITTIESGLDAAAWEREELRDALVTLREAISDFKGHGMPGFTDRAAAYLALSKADGAISSSRFALQRHLTENGGEQGASLLSQTPPPSLPAVPDVKEEEQTLEEPGDVAANTVQGPMALPEWFRELKSMRSQVPRGPFWWAQNYQLEEYHWALNDPESNKDGRVSDIYTILEASYPTATDGKKVGKQLFPRLIVKSLNALPELLELAEKALLSAQEPNFDAASEFSQTSFETGGRNALNLQPILTPEIVALANQPHYQTTDEEQKKIHRALKDVVKLQDARAASDGKEQGEN